MNWRCWKNDCFTFSGTFTFIFILSGIELIVEAYAETLFVGIIFKLVVGTVAIYTKVIGTCTKYIIRYQRDAQRTVFQERFGKLRIYSSFCFFDGIALLCTKCQSSFYGSIRSMYLPASIYSLANRERSFTTIQSTAPSFISCIISLNAGRSKEAPE